MAVKKRLGALSAAGGLAALSFAFAPVTHVFGANPSQGCNDGIGGETEVQIITTPVLLAVEIGDNGSALNPHVAVCYATAPEGTTTPEAAGGFVSMYALSAGSNPQSVSISTVSDPNAVSGQAKAASSGEVKTGHLR